MVMVSDVFSRDDGASLPERWWEKDRGRCLWFRPRDGETTG